jgi:hypothetical protein
VFKKLILPLQVVLLNRRLCPGCTYPLDKAGKREHLRPNKILVECKCKRRYILDQETDQYRRATFEEEEEYLNKRSNIQ